MRISSLLSRYLGLANFAKMPPKKKGAKDKAGDDADHLTRIAIIKKDKCKPKKCRQECKKSCPVVKMGKLCIEVGPKSKLAFISEPLCIGELALDFDGCSELTRYVLVVHERCADALRVC